MKYNKDSIFGYGLETIDYQLNDWFVKDAIALTESFKNGTIDDTKWKLGFANLVQKRFNIMVEMGIEETEEINAWAMPVDLDDGNVLRSTFIFLKEYQDYTTQQRRDVMKKIASGDLTPTGLLDFKKARVGGIFSKIPIGIGITRGHLDECNAPEIIATMLHEIGHVWTFFEFIGVSTFRNAIITNTVLECIGAKSPQDKMQIVINAKNVWGIDVDPTDIAKLNDKGIRTVLVGAYNRVYTQDVGYTQYNNNTIEAIADQFAARFGLGAEVLIKHDLTIYRTLSTLQTVFWGVVIAKTAFYVGAAIVAVMTGGISALYGVASAALTAEVVFSIVGLDISGLWNIPIASHFKNGSIYDELKDRHKRVYNETVGILKLNKISREMMIKVIKDLEIIKSYIEKTPEFKSIPLRLLRWASASFREQEAKKLYQQLVEELMANDLYVAAAKLKTI